MELRINVLGCANLGIVNTYHSHRPFIWLFLLVLPHLSSHSLSIHAIAGFITVVCNKQDFILLIAEILH